MEGLEFGTILGASEIDALFGDTPDINTEKQQETPPPANKEEETKKEQEETTEITRVEDLFNEESESVGSEEESEEKEDTKALAMEE